MPDHLAPGEADDELEAGLEEFDDEGDVDPAFYRHGGVSLSEAEKEALGDLAGKTVKKAIVVKRKLVNFVVG